MSRQAKATLQRLGPEGLSRVIDDLFDQARLVRLANACALSYPGMRTRTQARERLVADLARKALAEAAAAREVVRQLRKETDGRRRTWERDGLDGWEARLRDPGFLAGDGNAGAAAFLIAAGVVPGDDDTLAAVLNGSGSDAAKAPAAESRPDPAARAPEAPAGESPDRGRVRLEKKIQELHSKVRHQNEQVRKLKETERTLRRDVMERRGELAECRMTVERLTKELDAARKAPEPAAQESAVLRAVDAATRAVRRVGTRQRKIDETLTAVAERLERMAAEPRRKSGDEDPERVPAAVEALRGEVASERRASRKSARDAAARVEELLARVDAMAAKIDELARGPGRRPSRGKPRVGVFIDVQNVFYGARQLKGKLDFDALMEAAVRDRRLILAQAYVVESKEIDQSGFIAVLEHRAIQVRRKTLTVRSDGSMKGDWDMDIALDILDRAADLDVVVLVSGDGDFTSLVRRVRTIGPRVEVLAFPRNTAKSLIETADHFQPLDRRFMIRSSAPSRRERGPEPDGAAPDSDAPSA